MLILKSFGSQDNSQAEVCFPEVYTGDVCRDALNLYRGCLTNDSTSSEIYIPADRNQKQLEEQARLAMAGLTILEPSPDCRVAITRFKCFYLFGLCDSSGQIQQSSSEQCETIRDEICAREFQTAISLVTDNTFPRCELLPSASVECTSKPTRVLSRILSLGGKQRLIQNFGGGCTRIEAMPPLIICVKHVK